MNFVEELRWRRMFHDMIPGTEEMLQEGVTAGYIGFDPTADSLHIGHLVQVMTLVHFQRAGHKPIALVGGATGMVGDPSGKSAERNLLDKDTLDHNVACVRKQLEQFLDFEVEENPAELVNNYDWFENMRFLDFIRDIGKHITINYMMAKDSVKLRLESGLSFTEFTYQLVQGYDFYHLNKSKGCRIQMGGSDQWGNIVTGTELIRRKGDSETSAYALTTQLIKKADGTKFGKTASGAIWLDPNKTSIRDFYQYWLNASDEDASNYIRIFTLLPKEEIEAIEVEHQNDLSRKHLQKCLAKDITIRVHGKSGYNSLSLENNIMFDKSIGKEQLANMDKSNFINATQSFDKIAIAENLNLQQVGLIDFLTETTGGSIYQSKGEARRALNQNAVAINKVKVGADYQLSEEDFLHNEFIIISKGKKKHFIIKK